MQEQRSSVINTDVGRRDEAYTKLHRYRTRPSAHSINTHGLRSRTCPAHHRTAGPGRAGRHSDNKLDRLAVARSPRLSDAAPPRPATPPLVDESSIREIYLTACFGAACTVRNHINGGQASGIKVMASLMFASNALSVGS